MSERRFTDKPDLAPWAVRGLDPSHPAMVENRTLFPSTVVDVTEDMAERLLVSGRNNRKLGETVAKGKFKGYAIFGLSLEERATCPSDCAVRDICYGNGMQMARRHRIGDPDVFFDKLGFEIAELAEQHEGLLIRLHVLGDFPSVEYVAFWADALSEYPNVAVYGYTSRATVAWGGDEIGDAIQAVKDQYPERFRIRWSSAVSRPDGAMVIGNVPQTPRTDEGIVCPAQTDATACCATCALCWEAPKDTILFVKHGPKSGHAAAESAMAAAAAPAADFDALLVAHMPKAKPFAMKLTKNEAAAEDLIQEAAAKALRARDRFQSGTNFGAWFSTIMRNQFLSQARKGGRETDDPAGFIVGNAMSCDDPGAAFEAREALDRMSDLNPDVRAAMELIADGHSYEDTAEKLGIEVGTVKSRVSRGRQDFASLLALPGAPRIVSDGTLRRIVAIQLSPAPKPMDRITATPEPRLVRPTDLEVEAAYQRDLSSRSISLIRKIVNGWDWAKFKPPICAEGPEGLYVIDGQHTAIAAATRGIRQIPVLVVSAKEVETRAAAFVSHNRDRLAMSPFQILYAEAAAGDKTALGILEIATRTGAIVPRSQPLKGRMKPGTILPINKVRSAFNGVGPGVVERIFRIAVAAQAAPLGSTAWQSLSMLLTAPIFADIAKYPDSRLANALATIDNFENASRAASILSDQPQVRAGAQLLADACALELAA